MPLNPHDVAPGGNATGVAPNVCVVASKVSTVVRAPSCAGDGGDQRARRDPTNRAARHHRDTVVVLAVPSVPGRIDSFVDREPSTTAVVTPATATAPTPAQNHQCS